MNKIEELLQIIANTCVVYGYHIENNGLVNGKTGILLFLYRYVRHTGNEHYQNYADDMFEGLIRIAPSLSLDFEGGLTGVGWVVSRLLDEELLDGEPNAVLRSIDDAVFSSIECDPSKSVLGQAVYLTERLKNKNNLFSFDNRINDISTFILKGLETYKGEFSLYHFNSLLYFIARVYRICDLSQDLDKIIYLMLPLLKQTQNERLYNIEDIVIYRQIVEMLKSDLCDKANLLELVLHKPYLEINFDVNQFIRVA